MAQSTSIVYSNPPTVGVPKKTGHWSTNLCDCFDDCGLCCITCWCPCVTFGQIAEIIDGGSTSCGASGAIYCLIFAFTGCQCIYSCFYRTKMRSLYGLPESPCPDCCVHFWCEECALCQMHREIRKRGFDMHIGYHENMKRMGGGGVMNVPPPVPVGMYR